MDKARKTITIRPKREDINRFSHLDTERKRIAAATVWAGMRALQMEMGPGHEALDLIASDLPKQYQRNWAKKLLTA